MSTQSEDDDHHPAAHAASSPCPSPPLDIVSQCIPQLSPTMSPLTPATKVDSDRQVLHNVLTFMLTSQSQEQSIADTIASNASPDPTPTIIRHDTFLYSVRKSDATREQTPTMRAQSRASEQSTTTIQCNVIASPFLLCKEPSNDRSFRHSEGTLHGSLPASPSPSELALELTSARPSLQRVDSSHYPVPDFARSSSIPASNSSPGTASYIDMTGPRDQKAFPLELTVEQSDISRSTSWLQKSRQTARNVKPRLLSIYDCDHESPQFDAHESPTLVHLAHHPRLHTPAMTPEPQIISVRHTSLCRSGERRYRVSPGLELSIKQGAQEQWTRDTSPQSLYPLDNIADRHLRCTTPPSPTRADPAGEQDKFGLLGELNRVSRHDRSKSSNGRGSNAPNPRISLQNMRIGSSQVCPSVKAPVTQPRRIAVKVGIGSIARRQAPPIASCTVKDHSVKSDFLDRGAREEQDGRQISLEEAAPYVTRKRRRARFAPNSLSAFHSHEANGRRKRPKVDLCGRDEAAFESDLSSKAAAQILCALHDSVTGGSSFMNDPPRPSARSLRAQQRAQAVATADPVQQQTNMIDPNKMNDRKETRGTSASVFQSEEVSGRDGEDFPMLSNTAADDVPAPPGEAVRSEDVASGTHRQAPHEQPRRFFPQQVEISPHLPGLYHQYVVPSQLPQHLRDSVFPDGPDAPTLPPDIRSIAKRAFANIAGDPNPALVDPFSLYVPRYTRGSGLKKEALCPICYDVSPAGRACAPANWYQTKVSAYNYHMQIFHGIMPSTGLPMNPPTAFRSIPRTGAIAAGERHKLLQGKCHACAKWIALESVKDLAVKIPEIYWRKHAAKCHKHRPMAGTRADFVEDQFYCRVKAACME